MIKSAKISLAVPRTNKEERFFTLRIKKSFGEEPSSYDHPQNLLVVSDIEGNFHSFTKILIKASVINKYLKWTFSDGHLVVLGDCFDRGNEVIECLWLIYSLEDQAKRAGGHVHFILGNHEIMNLNGDWRYIHPKYAVKQQGALPSTTALYIGNNELWRWICTKNIIERIGSILLVHGGISPTILQMKMSIEEMNEAARPWYLRASFLPENHTAWKLLCSEDSPLWYRGYYTGQAHEQDIDSVLRTYGVDTIVTGHSMVEKVKGYFNNKLINVDTDHANGISEGLLIKKGKYYRVSITSKSEKIK